VESENDPEDEVRYVRVRPAYRNGWQLHSVQSPAVEVAERAYQATLPEFLI
jgi:hypothetical protein